MKDIIRQALQDLNNLFGKSVFADARKFRSALADVLSGTSNELARNLLNTAIGGMNAYTRLESSPSGNTGVDVSNLTKEMNRGHGISEDMACIVIECIAELLGYVPPVSSGRNQVHSPPQSPTLAQTAPLQADDGVAQTLAALQKQVADLQQKISQPAQSPPQASPTPIRTVTPPQAPQKTDKNSDSVRVGSIAKFGRYDWRVLDVQNGKALLLSKDILEQRPYHKDWTAVTWENCTLRQYLNSTFYDTFTSGEQSRIVSARLKNDDNLWYKTPGGNDTTDKIFLLSLEEVDRYFGDSKDYLNKRRKSYKGGKFVANSNGWYLSNNYDSGENGRAATYNGSALWWWLRSPGYAAEYAARVDDDGDVGVGVGGGHVDRGSGGVRPALWLKL